MRLPAILLAAMCLVMTAQVSAQIPVNRGSTVRFEPVRRKGNATPALQRRVKVQLEDTDLETAVQRLLSAAGLPYTYNPDLPGLRRRVFLKTDTLSVAEALLRVLRGSGIQPLISSAGEIVLRAELVAAAPEIRVRGIVLDRTSGEPVAAARVEVAGTGLSAYSDENGAFALTRHGALRVTRFGFAPWHGEHEPASSGNVLQIQLERAPVALPEVVVVPGHFAALDSTQPARSHLTRDQIENTPQIGDDLYRTLARIPGLVFTDFSAAFRVRGGVHDELYVSLDGLQLHEPFHLKDFDGGISIVDGSSIGGVDLITGGFGARYGDRLTGVLNLRSVSPTARRTSLSFSLMGARAASQGTFDGDRGQWLISLRRGYLDYAFKLTGAPRELEHRAFQQDRRFQPFAPAYHDLFAKARYAFNDRNVVSAHVLHADDELAFRNNEIHPLLSSDYGTDYVWLTWDHQPTPRLRATSILSSGHLSWLREGERAGNTKPRELFVRDMRNLQFVGLRQDWELGLSARAVLRGGLEYRHVNAQYDYYRFQQRAYVRDGALLSGLDSLDIEHEPTGNVFGAYLTQRVRIGQLLVAELGLRADRHDYTGDALLHPRFNLAYDVDARTSVRAAWGRYSQAQGIHQLPVQDGIATFDPAEIAEQRALSIEHRFRRGVQLRAELYERRTTRARPRYENALNETSGFPEMENGRQRVPITSGLARGIEFLLERAGPGRVDAAASYAYALARDHVGGVSQPRALDQRHTLNLDFSYRPAQHWRVNLDWRYHSGWPYTPVEIVAHRAGDRAGAEFRFGERNSARLASYHRLDARISREFPTRRGRVFVFLDAFNVYNRRNEGALGWWFIPNKDYAIKDGVVHVLDRSTIVRAGSRPHYLLPFLPSFGMNWEF